MAKAVAPHADDIAQPSRATPLTRWASRPALAATAAALLVLGGCANTQMTDNQRRTATGAVVGTAAGAAIGSVTGGRVGTGAVIGGIVGAVAGNLWSKHLEEKQRALEQATQGTGVEVARTSDNRIKVNIPTDFSFDTGKAQVKPQMKPVLDEVARSLQSDVQVDVIGHTDSTGSDSVNRPLSIERADAVRDYLVNRGVASQRIAIDGAGSSQPVSSNASAEGRAQNRRVEIYLSQRAS